MMLCLDVGNSHIYAGVFDGAHIHARFRCSSKTLTSDEMGIFLKSVLRENQCDPALISDIAICSVVPSVDYSLRAACLKYFNINPFVLQVGVKTGLNIKYRQPIEVGADRIANAIAASHAYPDVDKIIIDFGTAITFCVLSKEKHYLGGAILPGLRLSVESLAQNTARLPTVEILTPKHALGRTTRESIQSGVFFGVVGACKELIFRLSKESFSEEKVLVIATGGFASMFQNYQVYDVLEPDLVLQGMRLALMINRDV